MRPSTAPFLLAGVALLLLSGCTQTGPEPTAVPTAAASATPAPATSAPASSSPAPISSAVFVVPPCDALYDPALFSASAEPRVPRWPGATRLEAVKPVFAGIPETQTCFWAIPNSDGSFAVSIAPVDAATAADVRAALEAEGFAIVGWGDGFRAELDFEGEMSTLTEAHAVHDGWWLSASGAGAGAGTVVDGMIATTTVANPSWIP